MAEKRPMPELTDAQFSCPEREAVWQAIKSWDINVPDHYDGYCGATGSHVAVILNALGIDGDTTTEKHQLTTAQERIAEAERGQDKMSDALVSQASRLERIVEAGNALADTLEPSITPAHVLNAAAAYRKAVGEANRDA